MVIKHDIFPTKITGYVWWNKLYDRQCPKSRACRSVCPITNSYNNVKQIKQTNISFKIQPTGLGISSATLRRTTWSQNKEYKTVKHTPKLNTLLTARDVFACRDRGYTKEHKFLPPYNMLINVDNLFVCRYCYWVITFRTFFGLNDVFCASFLFIIASESVRACIAE